MEDSSSIPRKIALTAAGSIILAGLNFISILFIARFMGPTPLGIFAFCLSFIGLFEFLPNLGFNAAHIKRVSEGKDQARCNGTFLAMKLALSVLMVILVLAVIFVGRAQHRFFQNPQWLQVVLVLLIYVVFRHLSDFAQITFQARRESARQQLPSLFGATARVSVIIFIALAGMGVIALAVANVIGGLVLLLSGLILLRGYPIGKPDMGYIRSYIRFALPLALYSAMVYINTNVDKVMIGYFYHIDQVAFYFSGQQITLAIIALTVAAEMLLFPTISLLHAGNDLASIRQLTYQSERYLSMIIVPLVVFSAAFAGPLITIFLGDKFLPAVPIFRVLLIVSLAAGINIAYDQQMIGTGRLGLIVGIGALSSVIDMLLNLVFIPTQLFGVKLLGLGAIGAATATAISQLLRFVLVRYYAYRLTKTRSNLRIMLHFLAAGLPGGGFYYVSMIMGVIQWYHLVGFGVAFGAIYLALLYLFGQFGREDMVFILRILHPGEIRKYIISELGSRKTTNKLQ